MGSWSEWCTKNAVSIPFATPTVVAVLLEYMYKLACVAITAKDACTKRQLLQ